MSVINRISMLLKEKNKTQADLCEYLGINQSVFSTWKKRNTNPPSKYLLQICEFLEISFTYLMYGEDKYTNTDENNIVATGNVNNSKIVAGRDNNVFYNSENSIYSELVKHLNRLSTSQRRHAIADLMDILEEKYPID